MAADHRSNCIFPGAPTLGALMDLCESNFRLLKVLVPELTSVRGARVSRVASGMDLHLEILEQTPYTTLLKLTYYFEHMPSPGADPNVRVRIYHDARQAEVLFLGGGENESPVSLERFSLARKWHWNRFLAKWLAYCLKQGHRFQLQEESVSGRDIFAC